MHTHTATPLHSTRTQTLSFSFSFCLSVRLSACVSVWPACLPLLLCWPPSLRLSLHPSLSLFISVHVRVLSVQWVVFFDASQPVCLPVCLSVYLVAEMDCYVCLALLVQTG